MVPDGRRRAGASCQCSMKWYRNLGSIHVYSNGEGVPKDDREAVKWYRRAAEQGDASAQFNLGVMARDSNGEGVPEDDREAVKWYRRAAEQGDASAQFNLGSIQPVRIARARECRRMTARP